MSQLKDEMPFDNEMIVLETPGSTIVEIVKFMRRFALESPPVAKGFYAQLDGGFICDDENNVTHINGAPLVADEMYSIGKLEPAAPCFVLLLLLLLLVVLPARRFLFFPFSPNRTPVFCSSVFFCVCVQPTPTQWQRA